MYEDIRGMISKSWFYTILRTYAQILCLFFNFVNIGQMSEYLNICCGDEAGVWRVSVRFQVSLEGV